MYIWIILIHLTLQKFKVLNKQSIILSNNSYTINNDYKNTIGFSFYFKINSNTCYNSIFFNFLINYITIDDFNIFCENKSIILRNSVNIDIMKLNFDNIYNFKLKIINNSFNINIENKTEDLKVNYENKININLNEANTISLLFKGNENNLKIILENIIIFENLELMDSYENIPYNLYFINFRHNHLNSLYLRNEYNNEFGPSFNGDYKDRKIGFTFKSSVYDDISREILWIDNNNNGFFDINKKVFNFILNWELNKTHFIYIKFDIGISYNLSTDIINYNKENNEILLYYTNAIYSDIKIYDDNQTKYAEIKLKFNQFIFFNKNLNIIDNEFFRDGQIGLNFLYLNYINILNTNDYNLKIGYGLRNNSILVLNSEDKYNEISLDTSIRLIKTNTELIKYSSFGTSEIKYKFYFIHKEFVIGIGLLKLINNKIISHNKDKYFVYYNNINDLERRWHLNGNEHHKKCNDLNCSICKYDLNKCLYCYRDYYLSNNKCILNTDNSKFVDKFNNLRKKHTYNDKILNRARDSYPNNDRNFIYIITFVYLYTYTTNSFMHFYLDVNLHNTYNINLEIFNRSYVQKTSIYLKNKNIIKYPFSVYRYYKRNDRIHYGFERSLNNNYYKLYNNIEKLDCSNKIIYSDFYCSSYCRFGRSYYIDFNLKDIRYGVCNNLNIPRKYKDIIYFHYNNCQSNCIKCNLNNNYITCNLCDNGYILNNNYCIKNDMINTSKNYLPKEVCNDYLEYCNDMNALNCFVINNTDKCNKNNLKIISCKENYYLNIINNNCILSNQENICTKVILNKCVECNNNNYFLLNNFCEKCSIGCLKCINNKENCTECINNSYYLENNKCLSFFIFNCKKYEVNKKIV